MIAQLKKFGHVKRGWLGVSIQEVTPAIAASLDLGAPHGALVAQVMPNTPAAKAGLEQGDVIVEFNDKPVVKMRDLPLIVADTPAGKTVPITVIRNGKDYGIRYYGMPAGYEFSTLLDAILDVSKGESALAAESKEKLAQLSQPVHLEVFVTPT